jgi:hypothetical protein
MRRYLVNSLSIAAAGSAIAFAVFVGAASAQDTLPPGPGMEQTMKACGDCHGIGQIIGVQRTAAEWSDTLVAMINVGAPVAEADFDTIVNYLATHFGPAPVEAPAAPAAPAPAP